MGASLEEEPVTVDSRSPQETVDLGRRLGALVRDGDVVLLSGELGAGKTCFVKGVATGMGVAEEDDIVSPTFLMMEEYTGGGRLLRHVDAYRLGGPDDFERLGATEVLAADCVTVIEWPERIEEALPGDALRVAFAHAGETRRTITFAGGGPRSLALREALEGSGAGRDA